MPREGAGLHIPESRNTPLGTNLFGRGIAALEVRAEKGQGQVLNPGQRGQQKLLLSAHQGASTTGRASRTLAAGSI